MKSLTNLSPEELQNLGKEMGKRLAEDVLESIKQKDSRTTLEFLKDEESKGVQYVITYDGNNKEILTPIHFVIEAAKSASIHLN